MLLQIHEPGETPMPHEDDRGLAVGIDLGTTNSVVAVAREGKAEVLRDARGRALLPSVVAYSPDGPIVGHEARALLLDRPDGVVSSIKRLMGRGAGDLKALAGVLPYELGPPAEGGMARLVIGGRLLTPVEISAEILRAVRVRAEKALGQAVDRAVITVPAYFDDAARTATRDAARVAGLDVLRLVNEPTAAALAYGLDKHVEGLYAVFDLGGGTFDFSLLRLERGVFQVLATGGDTALGGDDIDHLIAERLLRERGVANLDAGLVKQSLMTARLAKECLSTHARWEGVLDLGGAPSRHALTRKEYDALIETLVERTIRISRQVLTDAGVAPAQLGGCVLVGGSTRIPLVRRRLEDFLGKAPLGDIDPDEVVAVGAALQAEALTVGSDTLLLDVTPLSLGLETMGGVVEKIIDRNTPIPVAKAQEFTTYQDGQSAMAIHVVQGEREMVDQCRSLGRFVLDGIPPMVAGAARIRVAFAVDADGLLAVSARELTTGKESRIEVRPSYGLSDDEMAQMLRDSLDNAEEDMEERLLAETKVEARRTLNAVRSALQADGELLSPTERSAVEALAEAVERSLSGRERSVVGAAAEALEQGTKLFAERRMDRGIRAALAGRSVDRLGY